MKNDVMQSIVQVEPIILKQLMTEVKETIAAEAEFTKESKSAFGLVDMWNIRKNSRSGADFRRKVAIVTGIGY